MLDQGYSSEIIYTFRIRNKRFLRTLTAPSGRSSWSVSKNAAKEFLTDMYLLESVGESTAYQNASDFIDAFFSCRIQIPENFTESDDNILEVKATADLITRPSPLSLLDPFIRSEITETGWFRIGN